jgi:hypothetical protein
MEIKLNGTPEAQAKIKNFARQTMEKQPARLQEAVNDVLGTKDHFQNLGEIKNSYTKQAEPAYEKAYSYGDMAQHDPNIKRFIGANRQPISKNGRPVPLDFRLSMPV